MSAPSPQTFRAPLPHTRRVWYRHLAHLWWRYQWGVLVAVGILSLVLGYLGFREYYHLHPDKPHGVGDLIYYTTQLVPMISGGLDKPIPWDLDLARHVLPLVVGYAGLAALVVLFSAQVHRLRLGRMHGHVVVCGLGRKGLLLTRRLGELGLATVVIERDADNRAIERCRDEGTIVVIGEASDPAVLRSAGVRRAAYLISVCNDDGVNADVAIAARALTEGRRDGDLTCAAHVADARLWELLRAHQLELERVGGFRLELFSVFDLGARAMLADHPPAGKADQTADARPPHVAVVGLGHFGKSLVVQAARDWYPRFRETGQRLAITVVDRQATGHSDTLCSVYPQLATACVLMPHDLDVNGAGYQRASFLDGEHECGPVTTAYVCLDHDSLALSAGLSLLQSLRDRPADVVVRLGAQAGLAAYVQGARRSPASATQLYAFPLLERTCVPDLVLGGTHEQLARAIHDEYCRRQAALGETPATNPSLRPWNELPAAVAEDNRRQADEFGVKLAAVGCGLTALTDWDADLFTFTPEEIEFLAEMEHQRWIDDHLREGWRYAAGEKRPDKKTHPALVPWSEMPEAERDKDRDLMRSLPAFLVRAGCQVRRLNQTR